jgi:hypothetical protein
MSKPVRQFGFRWWHDHDTDRFHWRLGQASYFMCGTPACFVGHIRREDCTATPCTTCRVIESALMPLYRDAGILE